MRVITAPRPKRFPDSLVWSRRVERDARRTRQPLGDTTGLRGGLKVEDLNLAQTDDVNIRLGLVQRKIHRRAGDAEGAAGCRLPRRKHVEGVRVTVADDDVVGGIEF